MMFLTNIWTKICNEDRRISGGNIHGVARAHADFQRLLVLKNRDFPGTQYFYTEHSSEVASLLFS